MLSSVARLSQAANGLACCLPKPSANASNSLVANATHCLAKAAPELTGSIRQPTKRLARRPARLNRLLGCLADITQCLADRTAGPERLFPEVTDAANSVVNGLDEALEDLGVAIESREGTVEDVVEVLEAHLQQSLGLDATDVHLHLAETDVHASDDLKQVRKLCPQRQMRLEVFDVHVHLVDLDLANVDEDIRLMRRLPPLELVAAELVALARETAFRLSPLDRAPLLRFASPDCCLRAAMATPPLPRPQDLFPSRAYSTLSQ